MKSEQRWGAITGVVFDAVGTLLKPEPSVAEAYTAAARRQGIEMDVSVVRLRFQKHFHSDQIDGPRGALSTDEATEYRRWRSIVSRVLPEIADPDRAFEELWDHFGQPEMWRTFPDVGLTIKGLLDAGLEVWIGSNFDSRLRGVVDGHLELGELASRIIVSSEVGYRKPHQMFFQAVCDRMGLRPEQVLCVGDDLENDVLGARRAGLEGLYLDRDDRRVEGIARVRELTAMLDFWGVRA